MCSYWGDEVLSQGQVLPQHKYAIMESAIKKYSKLKKKGKTHRSVFDRNMGDVHEIARSVPVNIGRGNDIVKTEMIGQLLGKMCAM